MTRTPPISLATTPSPASDTLEELSGYCHGLGLRAGTRGQDEPLETLPSAAKES